MIEINKEVFLLIRSSNAAIPQAEIPDIGKTPKLYSR
jgi:hypothetical protein